MFMHILYFSIYTYTSMYIMFYFNYYVDSDYKIRTKDLIFILIVIFKEILNKMQYYKIILWVTHCTNLSK